VRPRAAGAARDRSLVRAEADAESLLVEAAGGGAIRGAESRPLVASLESDWDNVHLICSDGLPRRVSDQRVEERLGAMTSARQACEVLLQDALDDGGADNVTMIVARTVRRDLA